MRNLKLKLAPILAVLAAICFLFGAWTLTTVNAQNGFTVLDKAEIRLVNNENGKYGIRFKANVGEVVEDATYKMAIVPTELVSLYDNAETDDNIVLWLENYASAKGGSIASAECTPDDNGILTLSMTDVKYVNLNRQFTAIAYYELNGETVVADRAADGR